MSARLPALIFDCDGVLVDSENLASRVESELTGELGLPLTVAEAHSLFLGRTVEGVVSAIAERTGTRPTSAWIYNWAFATAHAFHRELRPIEGLREALVTLRKSGHAMAVASQSPLARVRFSLDVAGLAEFFGERVCVTSMVARPKPAPDIYLLAAEKLGTSASHCVVIEDSPAGAAAAVAAGMQAIGYAPGGTRRAMESSGARVIGSMYELIDALGAIPMPR